MTEVSIALVILGALAWDIARRKLRGIAIEKYDARLTQIESNLQEVAVDVLRAQATADKNAKVTEALGIDWLKRFDQVEASVAKREKDLTTKVGGAIASLPSKGYNR